MTIYLECRPQINHILSNLASRTLPKSSSAVQDPSSQGLAWTSPYLSHHWWVIRRFDPTDPADHSTIVTAQSVKGGGSHGSSFRTMSHWTKYIRAKQTTPQVERHRLGCEQRKVFSELTPGTPASSSGSSHAATTSTEHVTQVAETINRLEHTVTNLNLLERAAIDRAYIRHTTAHGTWELDGVLQDIQPKPRSHELCFSHVYMKTLGFQSLLPRLDTFNTFLKRSSNDHEIVCKEQLPGHPHPKISR